jgi:hypothetical protein
MPKPVTAEMLAFLDDLNEWVSQGRALGAFAKEKGIAPGTVTYRMRMHGLDDRRAEGLVDARDGTPYAELKEAGFFAVADTPEPAKAAA